MIAIPESEQDRITRELRQEDLVRDARNIEDAMLTECDNDFKDCIHKMALEVAVLKRRIAELEDK